MAIQRTRVNFDFHRPKAGHLVRGAEDRLEQLRENQRMSRHACCIESARYQGCGFRLPVLNQ